MTVHEHVQQTLSAMRDGQADPDQRFLAERHLQQCATCRSAAAAFAGVDALAREVPPRRRRLWLAGVAAVLVVAALVIASIVVSPAGRGPLPVPTTAPGTAPQLLTLAKVMVRAEQAARGISTLQGRFTRTEHAMPTRPAPAGPLRPATNLCSPAPTGSGSRAVPVPTCACRSATGRRPAARW